MRTSILFNLAMLLLAASALGQGQSTLAITVKSTGGNVHITRSVLTLRTAVVIANQSNGDGRDVLDSTSVAERDSFGTKTFWYSTNSLKKFIVNRNASYLRRPADSLAFGIDLALAKKLQFINKNIYYIKLTRGGAGICAYGSSYFNFTTSSPFNTDDILAAGLAFAQDTHRVILIPFCGENEASDVNGNACALSFSDQFSSEINDFRARCGKKVRVIVPLLHSYPEAIYASTVQAEQIETTTLVGNATYVSCEGLQPNDVHYGHWAFGQIADRLFPKIWAAMTAPVIKVNGI